MRRPLFFFIQCNLIPYVGVLLVKAFSATYRFAYCDEAIEKEIFGRHGRIIYATWHQRFFPGITFSRGRQPIAIMISQSRDGEMIARVARMLGWRPVRGSSTRGGVAALRQLRELVRQGYRIAHIVDGPKGPFGKVKPGLLQLARLVETPIVPTIITAESFWVFNSWDRFMIPKPFSRVIIRFGEAIEVSQIAKGDAFEQSRMSVEQRLHALYKETDRFWTDTDKIAAVFSKAVPDTSQNNAL